MIFLFAFALAASNPEGCRVACIRSGYDGGVASGKGCRCFDTKEDYDMFVHNRTNIGSFDSVRHDEPVPKVRRGYFMDDYLEK